MGSTRERTNQRDRLRVAVLLSGTGRTLENLLRASSAGEIDLDFGKVVSSRASVRGNEIARSAGVPLAIVPRRRFESTESFSRAVYAEIDPLEVDLILMAGFLCKLDVPARYAGRILNIHPSLLPLFGGQGLYGERVHQAVIDSGMKVSGCTVHFVDAEYDAGPIVLQACVPVLEGDTAQSLGARVFEQECALYPQAVRLFAQGRLCLEGRRVQILPER